ncbi:putative lipid II flippase FtsW [Candidatus Uhrbacteria bacterium]|nr:putative lipid II flippase FtsW [Candidatus Uhrbacteria bacterium]
MKHGGADKTFLWIVVGLLLFGGVMLLSASGPFGYQKFGDSLYFFKHQLVFGLLPGAAAFAICAILDYRKLRGFGGLFLIASIVLLVLVYVPGLGLNVGGSSRWVTIAGLAFQPSEFVKVLFLLYAAAWMAAKPPQDMKTLERGLFPFLVPLGAVVFLLVAQPNTGTTMVLVGTVFLMYFVAGAPYTWFVGLSIAAVALVAALVKLTPYRAARFMTFLHPELDPQGIGYHINQAYLAIGSGGFFGLGYGHSRQKYLYLPEVAGDSIFAIMAEELGFIAVLFFLLILAALVVRCFRIAARAPDEFGTYLASGVGGWIAVQSVLNIASMLGLLPITGVTLPFVSYGSSALIALCIGCGLVASVSKYSRS